MEQTNLHLVRLRAAELLPEDATIVRIEQVAHGQLIFAQTDNAWDNDLRIFLIAPNDQILDRIGIEFHTCADTLANFRRIGEDTFAFSFLGEWEVEVLPEPKALKFPQHPLGAIFWAGEMSGWSGFVGTSKKENAFLLLRETSGRESPISRSTRSRVKRAPG